MVEYIIMALSALGGGAVVAIINKIVTSRKEKQEIKSSDTLLRDKLRNDISDMECRYRELSTINESRLWETIQLCIVSITTLNRILTDHPTINGGTRETYDSLNLNLQEMLREIRKHTPRTKQEEVESEGENKCLIGILTTSHKKQQMVIILPQA